jgi:hypothetical protein
MKIYFSSHLGKRAQKWKGPQPRWEVFYSVSLLVLNGDTGSQKCDKPIYSK